jgi:hypothetical protein
MQSSFALLPSTSHLEQAEPRLRKTKSKHALFSPALLFRTIYWQDLKAKVKEKPGFER